MIGVPKIETPEIEKVNPRERMMEQLKQKAEKFYSDKMEYHNFKHALKALECARNIMANCEESKLVFDRDVVEIAALFHDAGYHEELKEGYKNKEEYAAALMRQALEKMGGFEEDFIKKVEVVIVGTDPFIDPKEISNFSVEAKIMRAADVAGMAGDLDDFVEDNIKLKREHEVLEKGGERITWKEWKKKTSIIVGKYLDGDIQLTPHYYDEESEESKFHSTVKYNLENLLTASDESLTQKEEEFFGEK
ncbi:hypothetical protein ACFL16_03465 [Patescibacteria group bacterium]